ncbi:coiled-coil domain-containing protein 74A-like [Antechinus flavipes]|uniref:coiled-coil domain-containing protein 74A-like n=1 Tax=Antechinus flavipes TaxID=38775 RepID=UPI002236257C|nr:coiled-coil domain-containing protein 74A-like [Antechinus flavipes]
MSCPGPAGGPSLQAPGGLGRQRGAAAPLPPSPEPPAGLLEVGPAPVVVLPPAVPGAPELQKRVLDLEKSLQFVQQQHADTLLSLHAEVDRLRRDNRDLHYKLIMNQKLQRKETKWELFPREVAENQTPCTRAVSELNGARWAGCLWSPKLWRRLLLGHRPSEGPSPSAGVTSSNSHFPKSNSGTVPPGCSRAKHAFCCPKKQEVGESRGEEQDPGIRMEKEPAGAEAMEASAATVTPMVSCQPQFKHVLGITSSLKLPPHLRKLSTLQQCELVIRQLWNANHLQAQELQHLKSALEAGPRQAADGFLVNRSKRALGEKNSSHQCVFSAGSCARVHRRGNRALPGKEILSMKPTALPLVRRAGGPPASKGILALASPGCCGRGGRKDRHQAGMQFPKVADKSAAKKCLILAPIPGAERAVLPALKQTLRNSFAERQKKMQAIQSRRLHRTVL